MKKILFTFLFVLLMGQLMAEWTIVSTYDIPGKASGLATDGTYLYYGIYGSNGSNVYKFDPSTGNASLLFTNPSIGDSYGMTFDGTNLWIIDRESSSTSYALELSLDGTILSQIDLADTYMSGIASKPDGFWVSTYYPDPGVISEIDFDGNILSQFAPPMDQTWDLCLQDDHMWIVDYNGNMLFKTDLTGNVIESHPCENQRPSGIVYDGTYLWYVDGPLGGNSTLYKVDLSGQGTPAMVIPVTSHNYPNTTVGESEQWDMQIQSTGTADLVIDDVSVPGNLPVVVGTTLPLTIPSGQTAMISLFFEPQSHGHFEGTVVVSGNDPVLPQENISLSGYGLESGPFITADLSQLAYGNIRTSASKRASVVIQNFGDSNLALTDISLDDDAFYLADNLNLPLNMSPLGMITIDCWFFPQSEGSYDGLMAIENGDPNQNPLNIALSGTAFTSDFPIGEQLWSMTLPDDYDTSPKAMHSIQDITGDGVSDLVVCSEDDNVRVLNGNASGTSQIIWEREIYSGAVYQQDALQVMQDVDGDGYQDIAVGTAWGDRSVVVLSGKTGMQIWKHSTANYGGGGWVYQVDATTDYNGDDVPDVLAAAGNNQDNNGPKRVYCLNGPDGSVIWEAYLGGAGFAVIAVDDLNGDGIPDALAGATDGGETQGSVKAIDGSNGSILWNYNTSGTAVWALAQLDDINSDGVRDVLAGSFNGNLYLLNATNGQLIDQGYASNQIILRLLPIGDMNADGFTDVAMAYSGPSLIVYNGLNGDQLYNQPLPDKAWNIERIPDINGDLLDDVVVGTLYQSNYAGFYSGQDGAELLSAPFGEPIDAITVLPDITGDFSYEMVAGGRNGKIVCYSGGLDATVGFADHQVEANPLFAAPNPFVSRTTISFNLSQTSNVNISLFNPNGMLVYQHELGKMEAGDHQVQFDAEEAHFSLPAGMYLLQLRSADQLSSTRLIVTD